MFKSLSIALKLASNLDKIKEVLGVVYTVLVKVIDVAKYIQGQSNDTKLGKVLEKSLPLVIDSLEKVKAFIDKYADIIKFVPPVLAQSSGNAHEELETALKNLSSLLK